MTELKTTIEKILKYYHPIDQSRNMRNAILLLAEKIDVLESEIALLKQGENTDYKAKYEKCIKVIKRIDAGIIGMYDL